MFRRCLECCNCPQGIKTWLAPYTFSQVREAVIRGDQEEIEEILKEGFEKDEDDSLLMTALEEGTEEMALRLVRRFSQYIDFSVRNERGDTLLLVAIFKRMTEVAKALLPMCDPSATDYNRSTAFMAAASNGNADLVLLLLKDRRSNPLARNYDRQTALHRACYYGEIDIVELLLERTKLKVRDRDIKGNNCLHLACMGANITLTRYLMAKVVRSKDLLIPNSEGKRPLELLQDTLKMVSPLIEP